VLDFIFFILQVSSEPELALAAAKGGVRHALNAAKSVTRRRAKHIILKPPFQLQDALLRGQVFPY
jgi:hypothetical protein